MFDLLSAKFLPFNPDTFDFLENNTYVVLVRYHSNNELGFATVSVSEQEELYQANSYQHLHKKKYTMDQFSVLKIADLNYAFSTNSPYMHKVELDEAWHLITPPVTKLSPCWAIVQIDRNPHFGESENEQHMIYALARITEDPEDPLYGLYMTIYHKKKFVNFAMDVLVEDIGKPQAYLTLDLEQLAQ